MSWPVKTHYPGSPSRPNLPIAKEGILSSLFGHSLLRLDFQGHQKKTLFFSPIWKNMLIKIASWFFPNNKWWKIPTNPPNLQKTNFPAVSLIRVAFASFLTHVDKFDLRPDSTLASRANHCLQLPWRISHQRVCPEPRLQSNVSPVTCQTFWDEWKI